MSTPLEDYALIGDCETAALISRSGSIDWLCWPRFDSGACFAALLGTPEHGRWLIEAIEPGARISRAYRERTLVLETLVETSTGAATVLEFMPPRGRNSDIVRLVRGERGCVRMRSELVLRFDYGRTIPWVTRLPDGAFCAIAGPDLVTLHTSVPLHGEGLTTIGEFAVPAGTTVSFVLTHGSSHLPPPAAIDPRESLEHTEAFWRDWAAQSQSEGEWSDVVIRSLITLTALTYAPTGGLVAAPTTSLPEQIGGSRNWDYRFCWLRDATLTLLALMNAGYYGEARAWRDWLLRAAAGAPAQLQIMYGLAGERRLIEYEVPSLPGYESSPPVRIGNAAHGQLQLDVFGEVMDALHQARRGGLQSRDEDWAFQRVMLQHLQQIDEVLNAVLFLLLGLEVFAVEHWADVLMPALVAVPICLVARAFSVAVPVTAMRIRGSFQRGLVPVLTWSGLRGGISIALVLALPPFPGRDILLASTYAVVVFSVLVQRLTVRRVLVHYGVGG